MGLSTRALVLIGFLILGAVLGLGWLFRDTIDPPNDLAPAPTPPPAVQQPAFRTPALPAAPER